MTQEAKKYVEDLVDLTKEALSKRMLISSPERMSLGGHSSSNREIWGADAALDFIETNLGDVKSYLQEVAQSKKTSATITLPVLGFRAKNQIEAFLVDALPGCEISVPGRSMTITWTKLVE